MGRDVGMFLGPRYAASIAHEVGVQHWRIGTHRLKGIEHWCQFFVLDFNTLQSLFSRIDIVCGHRRHFLPYEAYDVTRQHRHIAEESPHQHFRDIEASQDGVDAWHPARCRRINREDAGISIGAAQALPHQRPRQVDVSGVHCCSSDFLWAFGASDGLANGGIWRGHGFPS